MKQIYFTVTNDLNFDQRMHRICTSLAANGYAVTLVGRHLPTSKPLQQMPYQQKRLRCFFTKSFLFYAEYNLRLFFYLLFQKADAICAIDLDTIFPCLLISWLKNIPRVYDAHEYFTELKEVHTRKWVKRFWSAIENFCVPKFKLGYTVSDGLADLYKQKYSRQYITIRNVPILKPLTTQPAQEKFLLYQGAVNEGRGFEQLIPAMKQVPYPLVICGDGNFMPQLKAMLHEFGLEEKVQLKGMLSPDELWKIAPQATLGLGPAEKEGLNQYFALPNKFFDYIHAGLPQIAMNFPEYAKLNDRYEVAILLDDIKVETLVSAINATMKNENLLATMRQNCLRARVELNWQEEEKILIRFWKQII